MAAIGKMRAGLTGEVARIGDMDFEGVEGDFQQHGVILAFCG